jgi:hypothetical protein
MKDVGKVARKYQKIESPVVCVQIDALPGNCSHSFPRINGSKDVAAISDRSIDAK